MRGAAPFWAQYLLYVWFARLKRGQWFAPTVEVDALLKRRFARWLDPMAALPPARFLPSREWTRAAILLFDQVPRNLFREDPQAYRYDPLAVSLTQAFLDHHSMAGLSEAERQFVLMPLMHSEERADQRLALALFARHAPDALDFARSHHAMIARFGRFPHRNAVLDRQSTPAETRAIKAGFAW